MAAERSGEVAEGARRYVVRVRDEAYLAHRVIQREDDVLETVPLRDAAVFNEPGVRARLDLVRSLVEDPTEVWAIEIELLVVGWGRPCFALARSPSSEPSDDPSGGTGGR